MQPINRLEFHISYTCFNNCLFCSERGQLEKFKGQFVKKEEIEKKLKQFSKKGFNHVTFTGGEPTLHPNFVEILESTKKLGYKTYVSSNGGLFSSKIFCRKTLPYLNEICFSLHGHNHKLHNFHTRNKTSFSRLSRALRNIEEMPGDIYGFINIVVTKYNFNSLEKIIDFVSRYKKIRQVLISNLAPEGNGLHNFEELVVPLSQMKERIGKIIHLAQSMSLVVRFFGLPLCLLDGCQDFSNDVHWSPRATIEKWQENSKIFLKTTLSYKPIRKRIKTNKCKNCLGREGCGGIFKRYYQKFGDNELKPILNA